jgi:glycosyltransferase involved in cell wall biosynthesis
MILHAISGLGKAAGTSVYCAELCGELSRQHIATRIVLAGEPGAERCWTPPEVVVEPFADDCVVPDVIHIHGLWDPFLHRAARWGRERGVPMVVSPQGMLTEWSLSQKRLKKQLAMALYQRRDLNAAALIHATAESEVEDIRRLGFRQPIVIAPFGIGIPEVSAAEAAVAAGRGQQRVALFVSRIHPKKGLANLLAAWARLKQQATASKQADEPWYLVIAGPDEAGHKAELIAQAASLGLTVRDERLPPVGQLPLTADVIFTGPVFDEQKTSLYQQADLFVLPTHSENFGVVILEALACGLPVITTKGAPWQRLEDVARPDRSPSQPARAGWWIDIGIDPLVTALRDAMHATDAERARIGENARWFARAQYSWPAAAHAMNQAYGWLLHGGVPPGCIRL